MIISFFVKAGVLAMLFTCEGMFPLLAGRQNRIRHTANNLSVGAINAVAVAIFHAMISVAVAAWSTAQGFGFLNESGMPIWLAFATAILILDFWSFLRPKPLLITGI